MHRVLLPLIIAGVSLAPLLAGAQETPATATRPAATAGVGDAGCVEPQAAPANADWRLQTYHHLDCLIGIVEHALELNSGDTVTISRQDAQRIRTLAWWSKDAAARIGR